MFGKFKNQKSILGLVLAAFTTVVLLPSFAFADSLKGQVLDPQGNRAGSAQIRLFDRKTGQLRTVVASAEGEYAFQRIPAGTYLLEVEASSAALTTSRQVSVDGDQTLNLDLAISAANVEVLVMAAGTAQSIEEVAKAVDVVDAQQISLRNELSISEAVRNLPGIRVKQLEGPGSSVTIRTRGLRAADTAVLIDGMRFRDPSSIAGDASGFLEDMMTVDTDRIEFLRGAGSSLYGSHALGGVLNVSSRPGGGPVHGDLLAEGGGLGMMRSVARIGGGIANDRLTYSGAVSHLNVTKGTRDGLPFRNTGTQGSARYNFSPGISLSGRIWYSDSYLASTESPTYTSAMVAGSTPGVPITAVPLSIDQLELFEQERPFTAGGATFIPNQIDPDGRRLGSFVSGSALFEHQLSTETSYRVGYSGVNTKRTYLDGPAGPYAFDPSQGGSRSNFFGRTDSIQARLDQRAGQYNFITFGYEFERERYLNFNGAESGTSATELRQRSNALYVQDQIQLADGRLQLTASGRVQFFNLQTPSLGGTSGPYQNVSVVEPPTAYTGDGALAYMVRQSRTKLRAHVGNSFRAPSAYERFGGGFGSFYGDPRLNAERAVAVDGGIDQWLFQEKVQVSATSFYTNLQQTIGFGSVLNDPFGRTSGYRGQGGGIARGFELSSRVSVSRNTNFQVAYTFVNSDSRNPTISGTRFYKNLGLSDHTFTVTATQWIARHVNVTFDLFAVSNYTMTLFGTDFSSRPFAFDGYVKGDVVFRYEHPLSDRNAIEFYGKVENVFNQQPYEDGFIAPKAWAIAGVKYRY